MMMCKAHNAAVKHLYLSTYHSVTTLQVCQGELISQDVRAVVNPTNTRLQTESGVSKAIALAVGPCFTRSCRDILMNITVAGQLSSGATAMTDLPTSVNNRVKFQHVIHAIVPRYSGECLPGSVLAISNSCLCIQSDFGQRPLVQ